MVFQDLKVEKQVVLEQKLYTACFARTPHVHVLILQQAPKQGMYENTQEEYPTTLHLLHIYIYVISTIVITYTGMQQM